MRTSRGSFFIEPAPESHDGRETDDESMERPLRHVIYRARHPERFDEPLESGNELGRSGKRLPFLFVRRPFT